MFNLTTHYLPQRGGAQTVYHNIACQRPDVFHVLTGRVDYQTGQPVSDWSAFDRSCPYPITRIAMMRARMLQN